MYPLLSSPIKIGNVTFRNRMFSSPTSGTDITPDHCIGPKTTAYYELKAKGGAAAVTISAVKVHAPTDGSNMSFDLNLETLGSLLEHLGSGGLTGDLGSLVKKSDDLLGTLGGTTGAGRDVLARVDSLLSEIRDLDDTVNDQVPGIHEALEDTRKLVEDMIGITGDTTGFLTSFRQLARTSGTQLDKGTQDSLAALAEALRKTARSTDSVGDVRQAKDQIDGIVRDTWTEYTGEVNNILLMDAGVAAVSLTSEENPSPSSVQVLIRSQEIKAEEPEAEAKAGETAAQTTFWERVAQMFLDFWAAITGIFP